MKKSNAKPAVDSAGKKSVKTPRTLAVDIGGTGIKALTLDPAGKPLNERTRIATPRRARPKDIIEIVRKLAKAQPGFDRVSMGFPGVVKHGMVYSAPNLGKGWVGFDLRRALELKLKKPVRLANDADIQGLGCATGHGLELVITLGTGFGSVLFADGTRVHLELGHHPFHDGKTYEDELGERALEKKGRKKWSKLLQEAIAELQATFNYDRLYIGGGNSRLVTFKLPAGVRIISNEDGLLGGIALWRDAHQAAAKSAPAPKPAAKSVPPPVKSQSKAPSKPLSRMASQPVTSASRPASIAMSKPAPAALPKPTSAPRAKSAQSAVTKPAAAAAKDVAATASTDASSGTSSTSPADGSAQSSGVSTK
ncbi:MAG: ROK family protein [Candidatus Binataceae bacterium]|jgi:polyphosphate glucokinase